ncbi:MAG: endopeptidase La [Thermodesulfobacteriota bacterium]
MTEEDMAQRSEPTEADSLQLPEMVSIMPIREMVVFPKMIFPMIVGDEKAIKLVDEALVRDRMIGLVAVRETQAREVQPEDLYVIGMGAVIHKMLKMPDGTLRLLVQGISRMRILEYVQREPYLRAKVEPLEDLLEEGEEVQALTANIKGLFKRLLEMSPHLPSELGIIALNVEHPGNLADLVAANLNVKMEEKQDILETIDVKDRLEKILRLLNREIQILELGSKIQSEVKGQLDKVQREYYLREQLKAIQRELGETDERTAEIQELREKIDQASLPEEARNAALRELDRLAKMPPAAAEYTVSRTYLDWLVELPWSKATEDNLDIERARAILDEDHYDLDKVKRRIVEYLAVRKLKPEAKGPILCFVGPPGTGKTSLGRSIARALQRRFVRLSLGGVRDEAEIRGHRRTYVGALPGRILQGLRKAGSNNPVFMLDEVDKLGMDFRGDPSSALLEVLDPEQNFSFSDHYLEVPFDLSRVMFITTANVLETIPPPLRDRMEVLELPGYTLEEKVGIARRYLVPRQLEAHGLTTAHLSIPPRTVQRIVKEYTREAGLRNLEREIATICRAVASKVASGKGKKVTVRPSMLHAYLGPVKYLSEVAERTAQAGVATGLAWTPAGGDILFVEATKMPGKKSLLLTGQLGDVMKESAQAALSFIRSKATELHVDPRFFERMDIHVHVPEGAIPKDGPSAGVTIFVALTSMLTGRPVRSDVAMTGEITLRGLVLPVGGIKEKVLAAHRAGIQTVILPEKNRKDLEEVPEKVRRGMNFHFVRRMEELVTLALTPAKEKGRSRGVGGRRSPVPKAASPSKG